MYRFGKSISIRGGGGGGGGYAFNISGTIQPKEDKSIIITPCTEITRRHTHITLNRYHRSLTHHWPHGDTVSLVRNILR